MQFPQVVGGLYLYYLSVRARAQDGLGLVPVVNRRNTRLLVPFERFENLAAWARGGRCRRPLKAGGVGEKAVDLGLIKPAQLATAV